MAFTVAPQIPLPTAPRPDAGTNVIRCLDAIRHQDPSAAQLVYTMYAQPVRSYLRRHTGIRNVEQTVFSILIEAVRSARESHADSLEELSQTVRELSQQGLFALRRKAAAEVHLPSPRRTLQARAELVNGLFSVLDNREREILLRSSLLSEDDKEISTGLALPIHQIIRTRAKARVIFRISSQPRSAYDPPAIA